MFNKCNFKTIKQILKMNRINFALVVTMLHDSIQNGIKYSLSASLLIIELLLVFNELYSLVLSMNCNR